MTTTELLVKNGIELPMDIIEYLYSSFDGYGLVAVATEVKYEHKDTIKEWVDKTYLIGISVNTRRYFDYSSFVEHLVNTGELGKAGDYYIIDADWY